MDTITTQAQVDVKRAAPVVMGRRDYPSVLLRLAGMDLYKMRRRFLSKVLLLVGTLVIVVVFVALGLAALRIVDLPVTSSSFVPPYCATHHVDGCINHQPATLADMQREKQRVLDGLAQFLNMPGIWSVAERIIIEILVLLGIILSGVLVGGEYSLGTIRLMYTRGPSRLQFLFAKIFVLAICVVPTILFFIFLSTLIGAGTAQLLGIGTGLSFFTAAHTGHFVLFLLLAMLSWFTYMLMALFFGTVGRSTVAGIVGPLIWIAVEPLLSNVISVLTANFSGGMADVVKSIPDYFLGNNLTSLLHNQGSALLFSRPGPYTDAHSLLVIAGYMLLFVGISCWLTMRRDVTQ